MAAETQLTPMMAQYRRIKGELPKDALLLFRLGDFYEMFFEDAQQGAQILNVALTRRNGVPMCGIPHHAAQGYLARLLKAGRKVAVCDQVEEARPGKLVQREVTQILSPGTHFDERILAAERNNYLACVCPGGRRRESADWAPDTPNPAPSGHPLAGGEWRGEGEPRFREKTTFGLAVVDLTTGGFQVTELEGDTALLTELDRLRPAEIIHPAAASDLRDLLRTVFSICNGYEDWAFAPETAVFTVREHFGVASLDGFGLKDRPAAIGAAGAVLHYLTQHLRRDAANLTILTFYRRSDFLTLDATTLRHLEVLDPLQPGAGRASTLYAALNRTVTPMGARRLRDWISQPLASVESIRQRQDAVQAWMSRPAELESFRVQLGPVRDLERTVNRLTTGSGGARDLVALRAALEQVPGLRAVVEQVAQTRTPPAGEQTPGSASGAFRELTAEADAAPVPVRLLVDLASCLVDLPEVIDHIQRAIVDDPPLALKEGGLIRDGYDAALDELRAAQRGGQDWIARLQQQEIERTGIPSLKVRFNSVFGYYIEVTKAHLDKVPPEYTRKQTIANGERYITPELKEMEGKILGAEERAMKLEYELFQRVREQVLARLRDIQTVASALAQLDVLAGFAETARLHDYCRPEVREDGVIHIRDGRHPVLEQSLVEERFVPNDVGLESRDGCPAPGGGIGAVATPAPPSALPQIALITGPNMAGKSTYIRQVALLTLLTHTGSFIPAAEARIDLVDRIFTRIGASDDLARGQSTFMVEMTETANILNNATPRSLIVLDEIGRGTSTFDGLSLAWSIVEHLHNQVGAKTLFATHYHELTELAARLPRLRNFNVAVREWNDQIVFLRKIVEGGTDKSYGIHVARLAGVPRAVIERAKVILGNLEQSELTPEGNVRARSRRQRDRDKLKALEPTPQLDLFG